MKTVPILVWLNLPDWRWRKICWLPPWGLLSFKSITIIVIYAVPVNGVGRVSSVAVTCIMYSAFSSRSRGDKTLNWPEVASIKNRSSPLIPCFPDIISNFIASKLVTLSTSRTVRRTKFCGGWFSSIVKVCSGHTSSCVLLQRNSGELSLTSATVISTVVVAVWGSILGSVAITSNL